MLGPLSPGAVVSSSSTVRTGVLQALGAYTLWGVFPLYFYLIRDVTPLEILGHRVVWCLVFLALVLAVRRQWRWLVPALRQPRLVAVFCATALLVAANWYAYIWAIAAGRVIEAALGYFINPLMSVLLGAVVLHERLGPLQWVAIVMALAGVVWMAEGVGHVPWIALAIATSFSCYALLRRLAPLGPLEGLTLESLVLAPLALLLLAWLHQTGQDHFSQAATDTQVLVLLSGIVTAAPLLLFSASTRRIPMSWVGMLQYLSPSVQTFIGVMVFGNHLGERLPGFVLIWSGCALFSLDLLRTHRRGLPARPDAAAVTMNGQPGA